MTVINTLSLKGGRGVMVADAQASGGGRKINTSDKLHLIGKEIIYGGSGPSFALDSLADRATSTYKEGGLREAARIVEGLVMDYLVNERNTALYANLGLRLDCVQTGALPDGRRLSDDTRGLAKQILQQVSESCSLGILVSGNEGGKFRTYLVRSNSAMDRFSTPNASIGSGADESQRVLNAFVESLPREKRWDIDPKKGLVKILEATNASSDVNIGVGGTPSIVYVDGGAVYSPTENNSTMAASVARANSSGQIGSDFAEDAVYKLITDEHTDFLKINEEMFKQAKDQNKLSLILRGFKV